MSYVFTDYNQMVGKKPRQVYWKELQDAVTMLEKQVASDTSTSRVNVISYRPATDGISTYPVGITSFQVTENVSSGYPSLDGIVETIYLNNFRNIQHYFEHVAGSKAGAVHFRQWKEEFGQWSSWRKIVTEDDLEEHTNNTDIHLSELDRQRIQGYTHLQLGPATTWRIQHNLQKYPSVTTVDSGGTVVMGDIQYVSENEVEVVFSHEFGGTAYLS